MTNNNPMEVEVNVHNWISEPSIEFSQFISSTEYKKTAYRKRRNDVISDDSIAVYESMFSRFVIFMTEHNVNIGNVSADHIYRFLTLTNKFPDSQSCGHTEVPILQSAIQSRYIRMLERIFTHIGRFPRPTDNLLFGELKGQYKLTGKNKTTITLSSNEVEQFLLHLPTYTGLERKNRISNAWRVLRDRAIQCILLGAGLKVAEVIALKINEIDQITQIDGTLKVKLTKNDDEELAKHSTFYEHTTYVQKQFVNDVLCWIVARKKLHIGGDLLFPNNSGLLLDKATVYRQVKKTFKRANISIDRLGGRTLRNTFAVNELKNGTSDEELIGKLGLFEDRSIEIYQEALEGN